MPQEIRVLQCFECKTYQVDIVKKTNKWQCKLCGVKQSVRKEFGRGNAAECRVQAQRLNFERGQKQQQNADEVLDFLSGDNMEPASPPTDAVDEKSDSKWHSYVDSKTEMFNFGSTQKWTQSDSTDRQPVKRRTANDISTTSKTKNSKWDEFV